MKSCGWWEMMQFCVRTSKPAFISGKNEGQRFDGDPYCVLPEQMAIQKLFLNQAKIDSVEVSENQVIQETDRWINFAINQMGSKEKLEEYFGKKISQLKDERKEMIMEQQTVEQMKRQLIR